MSDQMPPVTPTEPTAPKKSNKKMKIAAGVAAGVVVVAILAVPALDAYKFHWNNKATAAIADFIPYPAARVGWNIITMGDYRMNVKAIETYVDATKDSATSPDQQAADKKQLIDSVLDRLIENEIVHELGKKYDVTVAQSDIDTEFGNVVKQTGSEDDVKKTLKQLYGWNTDQFKHNVLVPYIERTKLQKKLIADTGENKDAWDKINRVLEEVKKPGADFGEIAKKESEDTSAADGGSLGEFSKGDMVKEFEDAAYALQPDDISGIVQTEFGYHIIKLEKKDGDKLTARHILVKPKDFDTWLGDQKKNFKVSKYI